MKKMIAAAAAIILTAGLCGCAGGSGRVSAVITETQDGSSISAAGLNIEYAAEFAGFDDLLDHLHIVIKTRLEADGKPLYEEKDFESWVKQDKKKQEAAAGAVDEWAEVR